MRTANMIEVLTKTQKLRPCPQSYSRTAIMVTVFFIRITVLTKCLILSQSSQRTAIMSRNPHISVIISSRFLSTNIE